ncbi:MAG: hypothetical protein U9Q62_08680 [Campylobacterota bacterium]|nr:hypothetical protein [Campylobacterota bacterium]
MKLKSTIIIVTIATTALTFSGCGANAMAAKDPSRIENPQNLKDVIAAEKKMAILAETDKKTTILMKSSVNDESIFYAQATNSLKAFDGYCKKQGGVTIYGKKAGDFLNNNTPAGISSAFLDTVLKDSYAEQGRRGMKSYLGWFECLSEVDGFRVDIKSSNLMSNPKYFTIHHDKAQEQGYAVLGFKNEFKEADISEIENYKFAPNVIAMMDGFCQAKGGDFFVQVPTTNGKALKAANFLMEFADPNSKKGYIVQKEGKMWCVDTENIKNEFTANVAPLKLQRSGSYRMTTNCDLIRGVNKSEMVRR